MFLNTLYGTFNMIGIKVFLCLLFKVFLIFEKVLVLMDCFQNQITKRGFFNSRFYG